MKTGKALAVAALLMLPLGLVACSSTSDDPARIDESTGEKHEAVTSISELCDLDENGKPNEHLPDWKIVNMNDCNGFYKDLRIVNVYEPTVVNEDGRITLKYSPVYWYQVGNEEIDDLINIIGRDAIESGAEWVNLTASSSDGNTIYLSQDKLIEYAQVPSDLTGQSFTLIDGSSDWFVEQYEKHLEEN